MTTRRNLFAISLWCPGISLEPSETAVRPKSGTPAARLKKGHFLVEPYIQLGDAPARSTSESLQVLWHAADSEAVWSVEYRTAEDDEP